MKKLELYVHTGGEHGEPVRFFLCRPGVDNNVAEVFATDDGIGADEIAAHIVSAVDALEAIRLQLDGREWDSSTIEHVALILRESGFLIRQPHEMPRENTNEE